MIITVIIFIFISINNPHSLLGGVDGSNIIFIITFVNYNSYNLDLWFIGLEKITVITVWVKLVCISSSGGAGRYGCVTLVVIIGSPPMAGIIVIVIVIVIAIIIIGCANVPGAIAGTVINLIIIIPGSSAMAGTVINLVIIVAAGTFAIIITVIIRCRLIHTTVSTLITATTITITVYSF